MTRVVIAGALIMAVCGCERSGDIGKDSDPASIRVALCMRVDKPPLARCEAAVKENALEVERKRPTAGTGRMLSYNVPCEEALRAMIKFAPGSNEESRLKAACCTFPDADTLKELSALCAPEYKKQPGALE